MKPKRKTSLLLSRGKNLREADRYLASAGNKLREAANICTQGSIGTLDRELTRIKTLVYLASLEIKEANALHNKQFDMVLDWIMYKPKKKKGNAKCHRSTK